MNLFLHSRQQLKITRARANRPLIRKFNRTGWCENCAAMAVSSFRFLIVLAFALSTFQLVAASNFDAGDALALVLGLVIGILSICACIGCYARRQSGAAYNTY